MCVFLGQRQNGQINYTNQRLIHVYKFMFECEPKQIHMLSSSQKAVDKVTCDTQYDICFYLLEPIAVTQIVLHMLLNSIAIQIKSK